MGSAYEPRFRPGSNSGTKSALGAVRWRPRDGALCRLVMPNRNIFVCRGERILKQIANRGGAPWNKWQISSPDYHLLRRLHQRPVAAPKGTSFCVALFRKAGDELLPPHVQPQVGIVTFSPFGSIFTGDHSDVVRGPVLIIDRYFGRVGRTTACSCRRRVTSTAYSGAPGWSVGRASKPSMASRHPEDPARAVRYLVTSPYVACRLQGRDQRRSGCRGCFPTPNRSGSAAGNLQRPRVRGAPCGPRYAGGVSLPFRTPATTRCPCLFAASWPSPGELCTLPSAARRAAAPRAPSPRRCRYLSRCAPFACREPRGRTLPPTVGSFFLVTSLKCPTYFFCSRRRISIDGPGRLLPRIGFGRPTDGKPQ